MNALLVYVAPLTVEMLPDWAATTRDFSVGTAELVIDVDLESTLVVAADTLVILPPETVMETATDPYWCVTAGPANVPSFNPLAAPAAKDTPEQRQAKLELRDRRAAARRYFRFGVPEDGSIEFRGSLPVVDGARLKGLVESIAAREYRAAKDGADRAALAVTPDQRMADALLKVVAAAQGTGAEGSDGGGGIPAGAAQITVLMWEQDLRDRAAARGLLADGTEVSAAELRRLGCDAGFIPVVLGGKSEILDLGRTRRLASPALRHAVGLRDGHCAFPGCEVPMHRCELHHIRPWQEGGPTCLENLVALCVRHHHLCEPAPPGVDADGYARPPDQWRIRMGPDGIPEFIAPSTYEAEPCTARVGWRSGRAAMTLHALSLFDDCGSLGQGDRGGELAAATLEGAMPDG